MLGGSVFYDFIEIDVGVFFFLNEPPQTFKKTSDQSSSGSSVSRLSGGHCAAV